MGRRVEGGPVAGALPASALGRAGTQGLMRVPAPPRRPPYYYCVVIIPIAITISRPLARPEVGGAHAARASMYCCAGCRRRSTHRRRAGPTSARRWALENAVFWANGCAGRRRRSTHGTVPVRFHKSKASPSLLEFRISNTPRLSEALDAPSAGWPHEWPARCRWALVNAVFRRDRGVADIAAAAK